jgi:hypothetical protein
LGSLSSGIDPYQIPPFFKGLAEGSNVIRP